MKKLLGARYDRWRLDLARALQARYEAVMRAELEEARIDQLELWSKADPEQAMTQQDLMGLWNVSQGTVSNALNTLVATGYVIVHPRQGRNPIQYTLSGKARVIAGLA